MQIVKANEQDIEEAIEVAKTLKDWFTKEGIKSLTTDFKHNNVVVAKENEEVLGFLCYTTYCGKSLLIWMGVRQDTKGIGQKLLDWLIEESKEMGMYAIELETLPEEVEYKPYDNTRRFYYKNGFKRILYREATMDGWDDQIVLEKKI